MTKRSRNKYKVDVFKKFSLEDVPHMPSDMVEKILSMTDVKTQAKCKQIDKATYAFIGDVRPEHIIHQTYFVDLMNELCGHWNYYYFNLRVSSLYHHIIISHEEHDKVFMHIIKKGYGQRPLIRSFPRLHAAKNMAELFKKGTVFKGTERASQELYQEIFAAIKTISLSCGKVEPAAYTAWKSAL
jgi:hypothetical protein